MTRWLYQRKELALSISLLAIGCASGGVSHESSGRLARFSFGSLTGYELEFFADRSVAFQGSATSQPREFELTPLEFSRLNEILNDYSFQHALAFLSELDNGCCDLPTQAAISTPEGRATFIACDSPDVPANIVPFLEFVETTLHAHLGAQLIGRVPRGACYKPPMDHREGAA